METMGITKLFNNIYNHKTVLITGHNGFKGSWLSLWLKQMGANVIGYSLKPWGKPNHFKLLDLDMVSIEGDVRDLDKLNKVIKKYKPDIVFHLAAQSLVRYSYKNPIETYETNVMGTLNLFEACRINQVKAIVNITSDKAYENKEQFWGYRENDPMGGYDLYSSSKGCAELLTVSYRNSFFNLNNYKDTHNTLVASCRAGNVIGGGDWAEDRLITDVVVSAANNKTSIVRSPNSIRPWQHVLEPLSGYLLLGQKLLEGNKKFADGWNFGPSDTKDYTVCEVIDNIKKYWDRVNYKTDIDPKQPHEASILRLDCSKANKDLQWKSIWTTKKVLKKTATWYKYFYESNKILTYEDINSYVEDAKKKGLPWTKS